MQARLIAVVLAFSPLAVAEPAFVEAIEQAHHESAWDRHAAVQADLTVVFGGNTVLDGTMLFDTPVGRSRITEADGPVMMFDGADAYVSPADAPAPRARFHVLTWPYFLAVPFKLDDPGTHIEDLGELPWRDGQQFPAAKLTFGEGVGDTPDDWYILYRDPATDRLAGMAYIVTYGKAVEDAEQAPHAIVYHDYQTVDGVVLPMRWTFHNWSHDTGVSDEAIGVVTLTHVRFVEPDADAFTRPADARVAPMPE